MKKNLTYCFCFIFDIELQYNFVECRNSNNFKAFANFSNWSTLNILKIFSYTKWYRCNHIDPKVCFGEIVNSNVFIVKHLVSI